MDKRVKAGQRNLYLAVGIVLVCLIGVQLYWIASTIRLQQQNAERGLKSDLNKVIKDAEENAYCFFFYSKAFIKKNEGIYLIKQQNIDGKFIAPPVGYIDTLSMYNKFVFTKDTEFYKTNSMNFHTPATVDISLKFKFAIPSDHVKKIDTSSYILPTGSLGDVERSLYNAQTLDALINPDELDSQIKETLKRNNFDTSYEMGIRRVGNSTFEYLRAGSKPQHLEAASLQMSFLGDDFNKPYILYLHLTDPAGRTIRSMLWALVISIAIIVVLAVAYAYFVKTILNQKKLSEMKSMFINNITHEFNTPITNINLAVENWRNAGTNSGFYAGIIEEENNHMQKNVEQMLQLSTLEHTRITANVDKTDINKLIEDTVGAFRIQLERVNGNVVYHFSPGIWLYCDQQLIKNMLYNLVDNAIKYSRGDLRIDISTFESGGRIVIQVQDNGIGMSPETMKYMYERFYRGNKSDRHDVKGFGIGLSYVKYIVDAHKGTIDVQSRKNEGTTFIIYLPKKYNS